MLGIAIHCIQHSQTMLEHGVCELAHSFFHYRLYFLLSAKIYFLSYIISLKGCRFTRNSLPSKLESRFLRNEADLAFLSTIKLSMCAFRDICSQYRSENSMENMGHNLVD